jgi:hypothetical protein
VDLRAEHRDRPHLVHWTILLLGGRVSSDVDLAARAATFRR